jgi:hypothetical protein
MAGRKWLVREQDQATTGQRYGYSAKESFAFYKKWKSLRTNAQTRGIECLLTFDQFIRKAHEAGIRPSHIGRRPGQYNMCRWTDRGNYTNSSCRFATKEENYIDRGFNGGSALAGAKTRVKLAKEFIAISPAGKKYRSCNVRSFCERHDLKHGTMSLVLLGINSHHKGWTGYYA